MTDDFKANDARAHLLFDAAERGSLADVKFYLAQGADPNAAVFNGRNALMGAAARDRTHCVRHLLPLTNLASRDARGETALMIATKRASMSTLALWKDFGGHSEQRQDGMNPLMIALSEGLIGAARALLEFSDLSQRDDDGRTALHLAAFYNEAGLCETLLERCDPDAKDNLGDSALACALKQGCFRAAMTLIERSNAKLLDGEGESPAGLAQSCFAADQSSQLLAAIEARLAQQERDELGKSIPAALPRHRSGL